MTELKERLKDFVASLYYKWIFRRLKPEYTGPKEGNILLLPPSDLDGSFGDELMVKSFIANFAGKSQVTIFTDNLIRRDDFLSHFPQVHYKNGFQVRNYRRWYIELKDSSSVFIIGADALDGSYSSRHSLRFFKLAELAHKMQKAVYFSGFSVSLQLTKVTKLAMANVAKYSFLKARDLDSYKRLSAFIAEKKLIQVSDMAFVCPYNEKVEQYDSFKRFKEWVEVQKKYNRKIIAFCPNSIQANKIGWSKYINGIKELIQEFNNSAKISILYLYHDTRPLFDGKSDLDISKELFESHVNEDLPYVLFPDNIENGIAIKSYLKYVDFTITGRMHFGISGLDAGKPMFGICYANKFEGMLRLFDIDPDISLVDYTQIANGSKIVNMFLNDIENQYIKINNYMEKVKELSYLNGTDIDNAE